MKLKKIFAFTLAEVLITLSILGVVAAITVPSLIKRQHRNEVETRLKKFISTLQNAVDVSVAENGPMTTWLISENYWDKHMVSYLNVTENHYHDADNGIGRWAVLSPNGGQTEWKNYSEYCLKDGTCFGFGTWGATNSGGSKDSDSYGRMWNVHVDINGPKGPNVAGKDMFMFDIDEIKKGMPSYTIRGLDGAYKTKEQQKTECYAGSDTACGGVFINNGYKFPSDYPWL